MRCGGAGVCCGVACVVWRLHYIPSRVRGGRLGLWGCGGGWSDESKGDDGAMSRAMTRAREETPLHGAFRCHQTDGTPQPHARSKRENPPSWLSGGVERRPVNREGTTTSTTEPLRRVRWNRAKSLTSKAQHPTCPSARASATNGCLQLLRMAPKAPKERRR